MSTDVTVYETVNNVTVYEDVTTVEVSDDVVDVAIIQSTDETVVTISNEQGLPGLVQSVGPGDVSVIIGGTAASPTVAVNPAVIATVADVQTLTNKTISGTNNTLTNLPASALTGTVPDSTLSSNVARRDVANTFVGKNTFPSGSSSFAPINLPSMGPVAPTSPSQGDMWSSGTSLWSLYYRTGTGTTATVAWADASNITNVAKLNTGNTFSVGGQQVNGTYGMFKVDTSGLAVLGTTGSSALGAWLTINSLAASDKLLVFKGAASQSGNIIEYQGSGSTTPVTYLNSGGVLRTPILQGGSGAETDLRQISGGGNLTFQRCTSATTNPGTNYLRLYVRDGTNVNTLKLVVRAGATGAETTILDNIPT